jgi:hypothetical protein
MELPKSAQAIADVIGRRDALFLLGHLPTYELKGGYGLPSDKITILRVPKRLKTDHFLVHVICEERAQKLVDAFGGQTLVIRNCRRVVRDYQMKETRRMYDEGVGRAQIAEALGVSLRKIDGWIVATALAA